MLRRMTSARKWASTSVGGAYSVPELSRRRHSCESRADRVPCEADRRWRGDWRRCGVCRTGASSCSSWNKRSVGVEQLFGFVAAHPVFHDLQACADWWRGPEREPGERARNLRPCDRLLLSARSILSANGARSWASEDVWRRVVSGHAAAANESRECIAPGWQPFSDASRRDHCLRRNKACGRNRKGVLPVLRAGCAQGWWDWRSCSR